MMDKYERAALNFANKIRKAQKRKPLTKLPKGEMDDPGFCPIANAINNGLDFQVTNKSIGFTYLPEIEVKIKSPNDVSNLLKLDHSKCDPNESLVDDIAGDAEGSIGEIKVEIPLPELASEFIDLFDSGYYPNLEQ